MPSMTAEEMRSALKAQGVPSDRVEWLISREFGRDAAISTNYVQTVGRELTFPIRITLPWSHLVSDNDKYGATIRGTMGSYHPKLILSAKYREAKAATQKKAREAMTVEGSRFDPLARPLSLYARVWVPDERPHDVANFAKCCHDGIEKIVVANDRWLYRVVWERAGVDVDAPRAEIEITPL